MLKILVASIVISAFPASAYASTSVDREVSVVSFMAESGLKIGLDKLPGQVFLALFANVPESIPEPAKRSLLEGYSAAYPTGAISNAVTKAIQVSKDAERIPRLMEIVSTPISRKMTEMELKDPTQDELLAFSMTLPTKPPTKERLELIKGLIDETRMAEVLSRIVFDATNSIELARSSGCADDLKRIRLQVEQARPAVRQAIYDNALMNMVFTYRTATDSELRDYLATYRDPALKAVHLTVAKTVADEYLKRWRTFEKTLQRLGPDLSDISMFAKTCRKAEKTESISAHTVNLSEIQLAEENRQQNSLSGKDARDCLTHNDSLLVAICAAKYR